MRLLLVCTCLPAKAAAWRSSVAAVGTSFGRSTVPARARALFAQQDQQGYAQHGQSQSLPYPWEQCVDQNGAFYYSNRETGESSWNPPPQTSYTQDQPLPYPWEQLFDQSGAVYYSNTKSGETTWERPPPDYAPVMGRSAQAGYGFVEQDQFGQAQYAIREQYLRCERAGDPTRESCRR